MKKFLSYAGTVLVGFGFGIIYAENDTLWVYQRVFVIVGLFLLLGDSLFNAIHEDRK